DPLAAVQKHLGIEKGIDKNGDAALAMLDPGEKGFDDKSMVMLIPVSDYKDFSNNFHNVEMDGAIGHGTAEESDGPVYFTNWGKYAAISPAKEPLAKAGTGLKFSGLTASEVASKDLIICANYE